MKICDFDDVLKRGGGEFMVVLNDFVRFWWFEIARFSFLSAWEGLLKRKVNIVVKKHGKLC